MKSLELNALPATVISTQPKSIKSIPNKKKTTTTTSKSSISKTTTFTPPYETDWFATENGLTLEMYLKRLFIIARDNLSCNLNKDTTKAILVPHAGIRYSGLCSASAYYELYNRTNKITKIILLCTHHQPPSTPEGINIIGTSYSKITSYRTAKPKLSIDTKTMEKLSPYIEINDKAFNDEHAFFNQIPFIETIAPDAAICPLLIGNMALNANNHYKIKEILQILKRLAERDGTVVICTSDLSHINGHFEHKINTYIPQNIRRSDSEILQFLYNVAGGSKSRTSKIDELLLIQNSPACGMMAMYLFGKLLNLIAKDTNGFSSSDSSDSNSSGDSSTTARIRNMNSFNSRVSCYYTSQMRQHINIFDFDKMDLIPHLDNTDLNNSLNSSVSYSGVVFTSQPNIQIRKMRKIDMLCSEYEKIALLGLAREQLYYKLLGTKIPDGLIRVIASPVFQLNLGVFTTLYKKGELRGCIGTLEPSDEDTIESNVKKYVIDSAFRDSRFPTPVAMSEFNMLEFSITILYKLKPITLNEYFGSKFVLGRDGILVARGQKRGYFLPSVAKEFGYDKQTLLEQLCSNKMGNSSKECFRGYDAKLFYNEGIEIKI
jgi:AmmeMemoRadiSam system protein A/AmmeMemoRadiSam system protein B